MKPAILLLLLAGASIPIPAQDLPKPVLAFRGTDHNGSGYTQYKFEISNYSEYPAALFEAAPDLPPCGRNPNASRTWIEIFNDQGSYLYGFCALKEPAELKKLWFAVRTSADPPPSIRVEVNDRRTGKRVAGELRIPRQ